MKNKKIPIIILLVLILSVCIIFGWYLYSEYQKEKELQARYANYPVAYTALIKKYAAEFELDPYLVTSIMRCESSNKTDALSNVGAIGLMQIMPDTGAWIAHKLDCEPFDPDSLYDPEINIRFACWYIRFLINRLNDDLNSVIAAYNAGHGSVEKWLEDEQYSENGHLLSIPFPETDRYLTKVTTAYENYLQLYPDLFSDSIQVEEPVA